MQNLSSSLAHTVSARSMPAPDACWLEKRQQKASRPVLGGGLLYTVAGVHTILCRWSYLPLLFVVTPAHCNDGPLSTTRLGDFPPQNACLCQHLINYERVSIILMVFSPLLLTWNGIAGRPFAPSRPPNTSAPAWRRDVRYDSPHSVPRLGQRGATVA